ncbi:MAG: hypothetical protein AB7E55_19795 [Pigmentiphaga sp.]
MSVGVRAEGLNDLRKELRRVGPEFPRALQQANKRVASVVVVPEAKRNAAARPHPRPGSAVANSIRATATQKSAKVAIGGARVPHGPGHEFGSRQYRQFPAPAKSGYIVYKAIEDKGEEIIEAYEVELDTLTSRAFPSGGL